MFSSEKLSFPLLNLVRLPDINIDKKLKEKFGVNSYAPNIDFLRKMSESALVEKLKGINENQHKIYKDRLAFELDLVEKLAFTDYFLLVWKVINKMKDI